MRRVASNLLTKEVGLYRFVLADAYAHVSATCVVKLVQNSYRQTAATTCPASILSITNTFLFNA